MVYSNTPCSRGQDELQHIARVNHAAVSVMFQKLNQQLCRLSGTCSSMLFFDVSGAQLLPIACLSLKVDDYSLPRPGLTSLSRTSHIFSAWRLPGRKTVLNAYLKTSILGCMKIFAWPPTPHITIALCEYHRCKQRDESSLSPFTAPVSSIFSQRLRTN